MRALCGAVIAAGAMLGLGLTALGIGTRYQHEDWLKYDSTTTDRQPFVIHLHQMDPALVFALVFTACVAVIGLGIAFLGLAYHHHRREREHHWARERAALHAAQHAAQHRTTV
jgi:hypothetical protein